MIRNPTDIKIAKMQLLLASISAPVDIRNAQQRYHAHRMLYNVHLLALSARNDILDAYADRRRGRPKSAALDHWIATDDNAP